jgi:hypothetical protein
MKRQYLTSLIGPAMAAALILMFPAYAAADRPMGDREMNAALRSSGFKVRPASTAGQRHDLRGMRDDQFTVVNQNGNTYYLFVDKATNRLYVGDQWAYRAYQGYVRNRHLREKGVFVWEVRPGDRANNKTVDIYHDWTPFDQWR